MKDRTSFYLASAALLLAATAVPIAVVAATRAGGDGTTTASTHEMNMGNGAMEQHMTAAPTAGVPNATANLGGAPIPPRINKGVYQFRLEAKPVRWKILAETRVTAWTYNGTVPGPELRVPYGSLVRVVVKNSLPEPTTVHWHGIAVPNEMDGVPGITQEPIEPGESFTYEFRAIPAGRNSQGGTFFYHSHFDEDRQVGLGLSGAFVIVPPKQVDYDVERTLMLAEWNLDAATGDTRPPMEMEGMLPNFFTINGKSFPATETIRVKPGQRVLLRVVGAGQFVHPMHLHGTDFQVVGKDGHPVTDGLQQDVVQVAPGERYDIAFTATEEGTWVFHCHIGHHLTNDGASPGGLMLAVEVG